MKNIIFLLVMTLILSSCENEGTIIPIDYDSIELDTFIINNYSEDAKDLYFREILNNTSHPNYNDPNLNYNNINDILKQIQLVYESNSIYKDTIFEIYNIHSRPNYQLNTLILQVLPESPEIINLVNGVFPTGHYGLDNIISTYNFDSIRTFSSYPDFPFIVISSATDYNLIPIGDALKSITSITYVELNGLMGDGNDISIEYLNDDVLMTFSIGEGDCPSGCIYHRYWEFTLFNTTAEFTQVYEN